MYTSLYVKFPVFL